MAASFNLTLSGVGDQIAAAVAESLKHLRIGDKGPSASSIGEEVGKNVAAVLETALSGTKKPTFDIREQILANADAILDLYHSGVKCYISGFTLTIAGTGEQTEAALVAKRDHASVVRERLGSLVIIQGPQRASDIDALLALHDVTKLALARARSQADTNARKFGGVYAFSEIADLWPST